MIILNFLKQNAETAFARRDIAKRAVKRRIYEADPHWADQPLQTLVARDSVVVTESGFYRVRKKGFE